MGKKIIQAAGSIVYRITEPEQLRVCIIHRPRYDDWSFPKGKLLQHESLAHAAVRETAEESGAHVVLEAPLGRISYVLGSDNSDAVVSSTTHKNQQKKPNTGATKHVYYWIARDIDTHLQSARNASFGHIIHRTEKETDEIRWLSIDEALALLTRSDDKNILLTFSERMQASSQHRCTLILARHADCTPKKMWNGSSQTRPLSPLGAAQAHALTTELSCFMPQHMYAENLTACIRTARAWEETTGLTTHIMDTSNRSTSKHRIHEKESTSAPDTFAPLIADVLESVMHSPRACAAFITTKQHLCEAADILTPLSCNDSIMHTLTELLRGKKALAAGQAVAITLESRTQSDSTNSCMITSVQKVEPIVF
ncbi:NUDIX domain-containing protein [Alloscardovia omnicolens]|uniref:NUDIX domain-containing protein n=1 Tax=Alloscardovia omnicolens TaxID=419015 RepID=UPI003A68B0A2